MSEQSACFRSFIVYFLMFRSLMRFEFIFVYGVIEYSNFILLHVAVQFSQYHLLKRLPFSITYPCFLCHRLIQHKCMGLFLDFLYYSVNLYFWVFLCRDHTASITVAVWFSIKPRSVIPPALFFFSQDHFGFLRSFVFPYQFKIICSCLVKKMHW